MTGFSDRYVAKVAQVLDKVAAESQSAGDRERAVRFKTSVASAAYLLSASPNAEVALLDMIVHVSLMRDAVNGALGQSTFGAARAQVAAPFESAYEDAWAIAKEALSPQQLLDLRLLIADWQKAHPDEQYVFRVRF